MSSRINLARLSLRAVSTAARSTLSQATSYNHSYKTTIPLTIAAASISLATVAYADSITAPSAQIPPSASSVPTSLSNEEIAAVAAAIQDLLDNDEEDAIGPTIVRLAWHASGTYDKNNGTGGSDGATMRFNEEAQHGANAGLGIARNALEPIKRLFPMITYADLWTLAGAVAIEHMGGPKILWRQGRRDAPDASACPPDGRLPAPDKGKVGATIRHIRQVFERQGFNDREIVALIGAHALGRCHPKASGYSGPWTRSPTTFSNQFFKELADNTWTLKQWDGPDQFEDPTGDLMMLPADMALLWDSEFRKYVVEFARDEDSFFRDFAMAFQKLEENGVKAFDSLGGGGQGKPWYQFW